MKASELRIGNYVKTDNDFVIKSYSAEGLYNIIKRIDEYQPIPLTEEWLLKFGFEDSFITVGNMIRNQKGNFRLLDYKLIPLSDIEIKYVHQLQNLYFALTNEELTITNKSNN